MERGEAFALLYADLDHFKAYNDHYGFMRGDQAIQTTASLIEEVAREVTGGDAFVGHVGGDDFVLIVPPEKATDVARGDRRAVRRRGRRRSTTPTTAIAGYVEVANRRGELQRFPLLSISIGVATTEKRAYAHYAEAVAIATEMKAYTKATAGSSWAIDRRTT